VLTDDQTLTLIIYDAGNEQNLAMIFAVQQYLLLIQRSTCRFITGKTKKFGNVLFVVICPH